VTILTVFQTSKAVTIPTIYFGSIKTSYRVFDGFHVAAKPTAYMALTFIVAAAFAASLSAHGANTFSLTGVRDQSAVASSSNKKPTLIEQPGERQQWAM
jgi:type IV secretory pathway TrbL component